MSVHSEDTAKTPQLTREEAIAFYESKVWEGWSSVELAIRQMLQERKFVDSDLYFEAVNVALDRPVMSHELIRSVTFGDALPRLYKELKEKVGGEKWVGKPITLTSPTEPE